MIAMDYDETTRQLKAGQEAEPMLRYFRFEHLRAPLFEVSAPFAAMALFVLTLPRSAERTGALRKLLEGKDAAVRAALPPESA